MAILFILVILIVIVLMVYALAPSFYPGGKQTGLNDEVDSLREAVDVLRQDYLGAKADLSGLAAKVKNFENKVMVTINLLKESNKAREGISQLEEAYKRIADEVDALKSCLKNSADKDFFKEKVNKDLFVKADLPPRNVAREVPVPENAGIEQDGLKAPENNQDGLRKLLEQIKGLSKREYFDPDSNK